MAVGLAAAIVVLGLVATACGGSQPGAMIPETTPTTSEEQVAAEVDNAINERIRTTDRCDDLAKGLAQREEDLEREAREPGYVPADRLPLIIERVQIIEDRMTELGCPGG